MPSHPPKSPATRRQRWAAALAKAAELRPEIVYEPATDTWGVYSEHSRTWYALTSGTLACCCAAGLHQQPCHHAAAVVLHLGIEPPDLPEEATT